MPETLLATPSFAVPPGVPSAVFSVLAFSSAGFIFREVTRRTSALWANAFKAAVATVGFVLWVAVSWFLGRYAGLILSPVSVGVWALSGLIGLNLSDWLMLQSYHRIGPARTMILYRFQPLYLGLLGAAFLGESFSFQQLSAIGLFIACVGVLSHEGRRKTGRWDFQGIVIALCGMLLDGFGILLTRIGFERTPGVGSEIANAVRCLGAMAGFVVIARFVPFQVAKRWGGLSPRLRGVAIWGGVQGTLIGLALWLHAVQVGKLATVSAVGGLAPVVATLLEAALEKRRPSLHAMLALVLSLSGFALLLRSGA
jgi:drug/metabolite transporter (DMT)-like permease